MGGREWTRHGESHLGMRDMRGFLQVALRLWNNLTMMR
jgi:hypothetical protein